MVPPLKLIVVAPAAGANVGEPQPLVVAPGVVFTCIPVGNVSLTATPVRLTVFGLVIVSVRVAVAPSGVLVGLNDLAIVGGLLTGRVAEAVRPVPPFVELTLPVVLVATPAVLSVTLPVIVQLLLVLMVLAFKLKVLVPTPPPVSPPEQVVVRAVETVIPAGKVSLTVTPVCAAVLAAGFVMVMVIVEVPFTGIPVADEPKAFVIVGGATTVRVALAVVPVPPLVELTVPVVLTLLPAVLAVTSTFTSQLAPGVAIAPPLRLIELAPAVGEYVPPQVLPEFGVVATTTPDGNVSLTPTPVSPTVLAAGLVMVMVSVEVPPTAMLVGANTLVMVGGDTAANVAEAVRPVPPFVELTAPVVLTRLPAAVAET
jgi:hypothetical protein